MYEITVNDGFMGVLLKELRAWRVPASDYEVNGTTERYSQFGREL
jgi:hypothetical protein